MLVVQAVYDILIGQLGMSYGVYRNLYFQYMFQTSCGVYLYLYGDKVKKWTMLLSAALGASFIVWSSYLGNTTLLIPYRAITAWPIAFWVMPIMKILLVDLKNAHISIMWLHNILTYIGKASYHIFCVQLLWFVSGFTGKLSSHMVVQALVSLIICIVVGCIYYAIEKWITTSLKIKNEV